MKLQESVERAFLLTTGIPKDMWPFMLKLVDEKPVHCFTVLTEQIKDKKDWLKNNAPNADYAHKLGDMFQMSVYLGFLMAYLNDNPKFVDQIDKEWAQRESLSKLKELAEKMKKQIEAEKKNEDSGTH